MIPASFFAALGQMGDPRFRLVLIQGLGITIALLLASYILIFFGIKWLLPDSIALPWIGEVRFVEKLASWSTVLLMMMLSVFLMVPIASAFTGLFLDDVADAVEKKHYPALPQAPHNTFSDSIRESLSFLAVFVVANLAALLMYFTLFAPFVFYGLNGFLLGREYYRMIAVRRLGKLAARQTFRKNLVTIWAAGALMAIPLTIPLINLLVPILGAATFTHLYHRIEQTG